MDKLLAPQISNLYKYEAFKRKTVHGRRLYENPFGEAVPSVTTILDKTKPAAKVKALNEWKKRVGEKQAQKITTEAADNGTRMHDIMESWSKGIEHTGKTTILSQMMADKIIESIHPYLDEIWGAEVNLCYPNVYAGTTDLVGVWKGKPAIMDYKQTNKPKKREWIDDYFMQGAAYALAHNELYETKISNIAIFMCSRDCEWQLFEADEAEFEYWAKKWSERVEQYYNL